MPIATIRPDSTFSSAKDVIVQGDYLYLTHWQYLSVFDISDPAAPALLDTVQVTGSQAEGISVLGDWAFVACFNDGFAIVDVHSVGNRNYGIFPVSSRNGIITRSSAVGADDSGIWVETSQNVQVTHNLVEGNVNGFEISNSDDVLLAYNEIRGNTIGVASLFLPDIFAVRPDSRRITIRDNFIHDNNKPNTAREGAILSTVPPGTGILHVGADDSVISGNLVENNDFIGIAVADYCLVVGGDPFDCAVDPEVTPGFVADSEASNNRILDNVLRHNGTNPDPNEPFAFAAGDLGLLTAGDHGNCYAGNAFGTFFSVIGTLPACQ